MFYTMEIHKLLQDCFNIEISYIGQDYNYWYFMNEFVEMKVNKDDCNVYYRTCGSEWEYDFNLLK